MSRQRPRGGPYTLIVPVSELQQRLHTPPRGGPLHGGAPGPARDMVFEIGQADRAEAYLREKIEHGERLMGFGHRVYKVRDPRASTRAV